MTQSQQRRGDNEPVYPTCYPAALSTLAPALPLAAAFVSVMVYASPAGHWGPDWLLEKLEKDPLVTGIGAALVIWVGFAWLFIRGATSFDRANPRSFGEILPRIVRLRARISALRENSEDISRPLAEAMAQREEIEGRIWQRGSQWADGSGYMALWAQLHRAEEALIEAESDCDAVLAALYDEQRIQGSTVPKEEILLKRLRLATLELDPSMAKYFTSQPSGGSASSATATQPASQAVPPNQEAGKLDQVLRAIKEVKDCITALACRPNRRGVAVEEKNWAARGVIREVRLTLNEFRDSRWDELVRVRNRIMSTLAVTSGLTFLLLAVPLAGREEVSSLRTEDPIISATALFLVGALVGLFNRLHRDSGQKVMVEDYDLERAHLLLTPIVSGLAAVGGVVLLVMLYGVVNTDDVFRPATIAATETPTSTASPSITPGAVTLTPVSQPTAAVGSSTETPSASTPPPNTTTTVGATKPPPLDDILNLKDFPFGIVLAALLGLAPGMVLKRLGSVIDQQKEDILRTEASDGGASAAAS
ncbi:MAG TPA: hypothetical protein VJB57_18395 [Dehalococcoidia bacterium]|nr:hypothetical protein [Dehalococcoidia bacterium]